MNIPRMPPGVKKVNIDTIPPHGGRFSCRRIAVTFEHEGQTYETVSGLSTAGVEALTAAADRLLKLCGEHTSGTIQLAQAVREIATAHGSPDRPTSGARADVALVTADGSGGGTDGRETRSPAQPVQGATEPRSLDTSPVVPSSRVATPKRGPAEREHSEGEGQ